MCYGWPCAWMGWWAYVLTVFFMHVWWLISYFCRMSRLTGPSFLPVSFTAAQFSCSVLQPTLRMNGLMGLCPYSFFHARLVINFLFLLHVSIDRDIFFTSFLYYNSVQSFLNLAMRFCNLKFARLLLQTHYFHNLIFLQLSFRNSISTYYPSPSSFRLMGLCPDIFFHARLVINFIFFVFCLDWHTHIFC